MRQRLLAATALLLICVAPTAAQTYNDFTGTTAPPGWQPGGLQPRKVPGTDIPALLLEAGSPIELTGQDSPGEVAFDAVVEAADSARFQVERACNAGSPVILLDTALSAPTNAAQTHRVRIRAESVGQCRFRWEAQRGRFHLANLNIVFLDETAQREVALRARILDDLTRRNQTVVLGSAKQRLLTSGTQLVEISPEIVRWATDSRTIAALTDYAEAVKARASIANPLDYDQFKSIQNRVQNWTPPVAQAHLEEAINPVQTVFSVVRNVSTGNVPGLISNLQEVGPTVRALGNTLRSLLGTGVDRKRAQDALNLRGNALEQYLQTFYVSNSPFLRALETEADSLSSHMRQLTRLQQERLEFIRRAEGLTAQTMRLVGLPATPEAVEAYRLSVNRSPGTTLATRDTLHNRISTRVQSRQAAGVAMSAIEADQRAVDQVLQGYAALLTERVQLDLDLVAFLDGQVTHLCALQPAGVTDAATREAFRQKAAHAATLMRQAAYNFRVARFGTPPLGDRVLKECGNEPRLTTEVPARG